MGKCAVAFPRHEWVIAPFRADRSAVRRNGEAEWHDIDAHRNLRGPYTGAGEVARRLAERALRFSPDLVITHQLTLLSVAPDLENHVPVSEEVRKWFRFSREGSPRSWTLRLAHGMTDFLLSYAARVPQPVAVSFENVDAADPLDREFLAVLLRRANPDRLMVRVGSSSDHLDDPLQTAVKAHACAIYPDSPARPALQEVLDESTEGMPAARRRELAKAYVESDCTSDSPAAKRAYASLAAAERKTLHRARAAALEELNCSAFSLGAIPFHHEQAAADVSPLLAASKHCMHFAYYEASLDWALRGERMIGDADRGEVHADLGRNILFSLLLLGRFREVEVLCADYLAQTQDPALLAHTTYAKAILAARLYEPARRDYDAARTWVQESLAFTKAVPPSETRAVNVAFLRNTLALVEMRTGHLPAAYELLSGALDYMAKEAPGKYEAESAIILHNRARLQIARKQTAGAIDDLTTLLRQQPGNTEAYFDRGVLYQRSGRHEEALRDYEAAIQWSPPYLEPHFNRAQVLVSLGRTDEALADYTRVLTLAPDHLEALVNRACLLYDRRDFDASRADVESALRLKAKHARLFCLRGLLDIQDGHLDEACEAFTKSIEIDSSLPDAWANRATILFKRGDLDSSSLDLTQALSLREDSSVLYNRGRVFEAQRKWARAMEDYSRALQLASGDVQHILRHLRFCQQASASSHSESTFTLRTP